MGTFQPSDDLPSASRVADVHPQVFISFSSDQLEIAEKLVNELDSLGIRCFYAPRDVDGGMNFAVWIVRAIAACDIVLVLLSPKAILSPHVRREIALAIDERRYILPFTVGGTTYPYDFTSEWTYWLSAVQVIEFVDVGHTAGQVKAALAQSRKGSARAASPGPSASQPAATPGRAVKRLPLKPQATPSTLLRAELETLPLIGRDEEITRLEQWALRDSDFDARVLIGGAGQGKTRLAQALGRQLTGRGWQLNTFPVRESGHAVATSLLQQPTLLIVDYAETRGRQIGDFLEGIAEMGLSDKVRLLLLARSAGDWWKSLSARSGTVDELLDGAIVQLLRPLTDDREVASALYRAACEAFGDALGIEQGMAAGVPYRNFPSVLDLLATALDDVLSGSPNPGSSTSRLLSHERRYIAAAVDAASAGTLDGVDLDRIAATFTLFGPDTEATAVRLLEEIDAELEPLRRRQLARVFRRLYPGNHSYIEGLRPDALAEDHIAQILRDEGALPGGAAIWRSQARTPEELHRGLSILARAAARHSSAVTELSRVVHGADPKLISIAIEVAAQVEDSTALVQQLTEVIDRHRDLDVSNLLELVPDETVNLAGLAAHLAERVVADLPDPAYMSPADVELVIACSNRFSDAGWGARAVKSVELSVERLDQLEGNDHTRRLKGRALSNLSNRHWETGSIADSVAPAQRAVEELAAVGTLGCDLAAAWNNLAFRLSEIDRFDEALAAAQRAHEAFARDQAPEDRFAQAGLGASLNNLACIHFALGHFDDAASFGREAVALRRSQALQDRDRYLPYVARTLANAAPAVMATGAESHGLSMIGEARALHALTGPRAPIFAFEQAESATIHAVMLMIAGDHAAASTALDEATGVLSPLHDDLKDLAVRLAHSIEELAEVGGSQGTVSWSDFIATPATGSSYRLPQLMEYKDI